MGVLRRSVNATGSEILIETGEKLEQNNVVGRVSSFKMGAHGTANQYLLTKILDYLAI